MKILKINKTILFLLAIPLFQSSCKKYLDAKTDKTLVIPSSIQDAQALINDSYLLNILNPSDGTIMADDYTVSDSYYDGMEDPYKKEYNWDKNATTFDATFSDSYQALLKCNVSLETLRKITITTDNKDAYNLAKGSALYFRGFRYYELMGIYCIQYDKSTANNDLGIPYKTSSDINEKAVRPSLQSNYDAVLSDLKAAAQILPTTVSFPTMPTKQAAFGLLARVYLSMNEYPNALIYADSCLQIYNTLMDYNNFTPSGTSITFKRFNPEVLFHNTGYGFYIYTFGRSNIDSNLYKSYDSNDLRKTCFFALNTSGAYSFRGQYEESRFQGPFGGIATDEIYLIRAEGYARSGNATAAMADLNTLLRKRWKTNTFTDLTATDAQNALDIILTERRKELVFRNNLRWSDIKRLNKDPRYARTLSRTVHGVTYTLPPNDLRYALLIPPNEIQLSGMQQNPR